MNEEKSRRTGRRRNKAEPTETRKVDYRNLRNPFPAAQAFTEDRIEAIHNTSLRVLEELGIKVLLPEAREMFRAAGARIKDDMVFIGRDIVDAAIALAPNSINLRGAVRDRDVLLEPGRLTFHPGAGAPHATDLVRGRRPGSLSDFKELVKLTQHFDVMHMVPPLVEPQDVPMHLRHYAMSIETLTQSDKPTFAYARGHPQVMDCFEMMRDFRDVSDAEFRADCFMYTVINTNSPRQIDVPMAQGIIDFALYGQVSIITPFTLMGAMAPITVAGALTLSHAEAMAAITLAQLAKPGAPVLYGTFTSNVDMKSGAPAMGTPEQVKASLGSGQLARKLGLPWRCAAGSAANMNDVQAAHETEFSAWGSVLAGATVVIHAAGWLESGLTISYEKFITDIEMVQMFAELCTDTPAEDDDLAMDALRDVQPGGHFFGTEHTMKRYQTAFYEPLVADWSNFGAWTESGAVDTNTRATGLWQGILADFKPPVHNDARIGRLQDFIERRTHEGGAAPES